MILVKLVTVCKFRFILCIGYKILHIEPDLMLKKLVNPSHVINIICAFTTSFNSEIVVLVLFYHNKMSQIM